MYSSLGDKASPHLRKKKPGGEVGGMQRQEQSGGRGEGRDSENGKEERVSETEEGSHREEAEGETGKGKSSFPPEPQFPHLLSQVVRRPGTICQVPAEQRGLQRGEGSGGRRLGLESSVVTGGRSVPSMGTGCFSGSDSRVFLPRAPPGLLQPPPPCPDLGGSGHCRPHIFPREKSDCSPNPPSSSSFLQPRAV